MALACTKSNTLLWASIVNPLITKEGVSLMLLSRLPPLLSDWPALLSGSPCWQLNADALQPTETPQAGGWLVLFGKGLGASHLARLSPLLAAQELAATLYPPTEVAGVPLLLLGCDRFSAELVAELKSGEWEIDLCHLPALPTLNEPGLLVMDMDSTAIRIECIDEIAQLAGVGEQVAAVTAAAMQGKLEFSDSLRNRVALLAGAPVTILDEVAAWMPWMPGLQLMVDTLKGAGWKVAIASGGFTRFAGQLQRELGLDAIFANELAVEGGPADRQGEWAHRRCQRQGRGVAAAGGRICHCTRPDRGHRRWCQRSQDDGGRGPWHCHSRQAAGAGAGGGHPQSSRSGGGDLPAGGAGLQRATLGQALTVFQGGNP